MSCIRETAHVDRWNESNDKLQCHMENPWMNGFSSLSLYAQDGNVQQLCPCFLFPFQLQWNKQYIGELGIRKEIYR